MNLEDKKEIVNTELEKESQSLNIELLKSETKLENIKKILNDRFKLDYELILKNIEEFTFLVNEMYSLINDGLNIKSTLEINNN